MIHIEHLASVVRVYTPGGCFGDGVSKAKAVATITRIDAGVVEIMAAMGRLSRTDMRELVRKLAADGIHTVTIKRRAGHGVPLGRFVRSSGGYDYYAVSTSDA